MDKITVYTDGLALSNGRPDSGCGWACKLIYRGYEKMKSGVDKGKTNNVMEMTAVLQAVRAITDKSIPVEVFSDSKYVVETLNGNFKIKKNVDTDKALEHIEWNRKYQEEIERLETAKVKKFYEGVREGLNIAEGIFECSNFEKQAVEATFSDGVLEVVYELGKELDIPTQDLRNSFSSVDDICVELAKRIKDNARLVQNNIEVDRMAVMEARKV